MCTKININQIKTHMQESTHIFSHAYQTHFIYFSDFKLNPGLLSSSELMQINTKHYIPSPCEKNWITHTKKKKAKYCKDLFLHINKQIRLMINEMWHTSSYESTGCVKTNRNAEMYQFSCVCWRGRSSCTATCWFKISSSLTKPQIRQRRGFNTALQNWYTHAKKLKINPSSLETLQTHMRSCRIN